MTPTLLKENIIQELEVGIINVVFDAIGIWTFYLLIYYVYMGNYGPGFLFW